MFFAAATDIVVAVRRDLPLRLRWRGCSFAASPVRCHRRLAMCFIITVTITSTIAITVNIITIIIAGPAGRAGVGGRLARRRLDAVLLRPGGPSQEPGREAIQTTRAIKR